MFKRIANHALSIIALTCVSMFFLIPIHAAESPLKPVKLDSPRATMRTFMKAMNDYRRGIKKHDPQLINRINAAVRTLDLESIPAMHRNEKGREMAILLKEVIDRIIVINYKRIPDLYETKHWRLKGTEIAIVYLTKGERAGQHVFASDAVFRVPDFYQIVKHLPYKKGSGYGAAFKEPWIERKMPSWAKRKVIIYPNWQWAGLFLSIFMGLFLRHLVRAVLSILKRFAKRSENTWDDLVIEAIERPLGLATAAAFWYSTINLLRFDGQSLVVLTFLVQILFSTGLIWIAYRLADVSQDALRAFNQGNDKEFDAHLLPLVSRALKVFIVLFGVLITIQSLGYNVASILAGLGLGGLAFALAARDTCANFFGSLMILIDRPFRLGDWIKVAGSEGTVEEIGFRSTRIRTFYDSQITIPNMTIATAGIDNLGRRNYRRQTTTLGITYATSPESIEAFLEGIKNIFKANPNTRKDYFHVVFSGYGDSSLNIMLYFFLRVPDWSQELVARQNIYLEILRLAHDLDVSFAFPTQTLHVDSMPNDQKTNAIDTTNLKEAAAAYGPGGKRAKPEGQGIFTPPYQT